MSPFFLLSALAVAFLASLPLVAATLPFAFLSVALADPVFFFAWLDVAAFFLLAGDLDALFSVAGLVEVEEAVLANEAALVRPTASARKKTVAPLRRRVAAGRPRRRSSVVTGRSENGRREDNAGLNLR